MNAPQAPSFEPSSLAKNLNRIYDQGFASDFHEDFFGHSGFSNFGYWEAGIETAAQAAENLVLHLLEPVQPLSGNVLDVACGQGGTTRTLCRFLPPAQVTAINISAQQVGAAAQNAPGSRVLQMSATALDFPEPSFDGLLCVEAVFHFETRLRFLHEAQRILKPGGWLALSDVVFRHRPPAQIIPPANQIQSQARYCEHFEAAGFETPQIERVLKPTWQSCRDALRAYALKRAQQDNSLKGWKEWGLNEFRCRAYDWAMADYWLVWTRKRS